MRPSLARAFIALVACGFASAAETKTNTEAETRTTRPLDLPSGGRGEAAEEEDFPETIRFFGADYEGDGFFFLLDKSGSMYGIKIDLLKVEMTDALSSLSAPSEFGIVAFSGTNEVYAPMPRAATPDEIGTAHSWVQALEPYGPTHLLAAAIEILTMAQMSTHSDRSIILVGDGLPNGPGQEETLTGILAANWEQLPFFTILLGTNAEATNFMTQLANATGGTFRGVTW